MTSRQTKTLTFISRHSPYGSDRAWALLDMVLASSVFSQKVNYLFTADGVYQLLGPQEVGNSGNKNLLKALDALELYGVNNVCVDAESLQQRGLDASALALPARVVDSQEFREILRTSDAVFSL